MAAGVAGVRVAGRLRLRLAWVPVLALLLGLLFAASPLAPPLAAALQDRQLQLTARSTHYPDVLLVEIDDASVRALQPRLGPWPYSRDTYALAIGFLRELGARVVVLDVVLGEPRNGDAALARALAERRDVVLAAAGQVHADEDVPRRDALQAQMALPLQGAGLAVRWSSLALPAATLLAERPAQPFVPGQLGLVSAPADDDGVLRRLPLLQRVGDQVFPSLVLAPLLLTADAAPAQWTWDGRRLRVGDRHWPLDAGGRMALTVPPDADAITSLPFNAVMAAALGVSEGAGLRQAVQGRTVFIGSTLPTADRAATAFGTLPEVRLTASAHAVLRHGEVVDTHTPVLSVLLGAMGLAPALWLWLRRRPALLHDVAAALLAAVAVLVSAQVALVTAGRLASVAAPLATLAAGLAIALALQAREASAVRRRRRLDAALAQAVQQARGRFLAHMSQEIRTPIRALLGVAELLGRTPLAVEQQRYVEVLRRSGRQLSSLIDDLLDLSRIEAGRLLLDPRPFVLRPLLEEQRELLSIKALGKGVALRWDVAPELPEVVLGDRVRLAQVLTSLIGRAIAFTPEGVLAVDVRPGGGDEKAGAVVFRIAEGGAVGGVPADATQCDAAAVQGGDTGRPSAAPAPGSPWRRAAVGQGGDPLVQALEETFGDPFSELSAGPPGNPDARRGGGLALSVARRLVQQMGGRVETAGGRGIDLRLVLPMPAAELPVTRAADALAPAPAPIRAAPDTPAGVPARAPGQVPADAPATPSTDVPVPAPAARPVARRQDGRLRVLLTEDNDINVMVVEAMLADQDIDIDVAANGEEALAKFRRGGHGLVLMDIQMPGIDGHEATRELRRIEAAEGRPPVPVIALTANAQERDARRSLEAGCNAHLTKPIRREDLLATIQGFCTAER